MLRPRLLSVSEAAAELRASEAYVRRLLLRQRLHGIKVGTVWAVLPDDLEAFKRIRRAPGRPRKAAAGIEGGNKKLGRGARGRILTTDATT